MLTNLKTMGLKYGFTPSTIRTYLGRYEFAPYVQLVKKDTGYYEMMYDLTPETDLLFKSFLNKKKRGKQCR